MKTSTKSLVTLNDESLATVSGAKHCYKREPRRWFPLELTQQSSQITNFVAVVGDGNSVSISNDVSQSA